MKQLSRYLNNCLDEKKKKNKKLFIPYLALGDPDWETSYEIVHILFELGADTIELGLPFTDPIADGPVLQRSFKRILDADFNLNDVFDFLEKIQMDYPNKSFLLMGYANLFYQYGFSKFFKKVQSYGVDGLVIPDIPFEEKKNHKELQESSLSLIDFITPTIKDHKIKKISSEAEGFLYLVSTKGVTGKSQFDKQLKVIAQKARKLANIPVVVGFGIRTNEQIKILRDFVDGFIIGSLIHEIIEEKLTHKKRIPKKIKKILRGIVEDI